MDFNINVLFPPSFYKCYLLVISFLAQLLNDQSVDCAKMSKFMSLSSHLPLNWTLVMAFHVLSIRYSPVSHSNCRNCCPEKKKKEKRNYRSSGIISSILRYITCYEREKLWDKHYGNFILLLLGKIDFYILG